MTHQILENGVVRDATPEEAAEIEARKAAATTAQPAPAPTKEQLLAQLQVLQAQINALG